MLPTADLGSVVPQGFRVSQSFQSNLVFDIQAAKLTFLARIYMYNHNVGAAAKSGRLRHFVVAPP